jgi:hypothetical protein
MRALLLILLLANLVLLAYQQSWLGQMPPTGREPGRLARQIQPEAIRVLSEVDLKQLSERGRDGSNGAERKEVALACVELGDFAADAAVRVQARLGAMNLGARLATIEVELPGWYMVYMPPFKTRAEAERMADDLRGRGVRDLMVIEDSSGLRNAISLGQFKDQELALRHQSDLERRGVKGVRVSVRSGGGTAMRFRIKSPDTTLAQQLTALQKEFAATRLAPCTE